MILGAVKFAYLAIGAILLPFFTYLGLVSASALLRRRRRPEAGPGTTRFLIVIPAHDEQDSIAATVESCRSMAYDPRLFRVLVIADNCTDLTAEAARIADAEVVERFDSTRRSKGYALEDILKPENLRDADAVLVIDADTVVDPDLLSAFSGAIASGHDWMQCYYTVRNAGASWRTRLMTYAFSLFNGVSLLGQEGLGLGAGFKGNGMCFTTKGLKRVPWKACGLVEDMEFSWRLHALGERIHFLPRSRVYGEMVSRGGRAAASQRRRWEAGRRSIPRKYFGVVARSPSLGLYRKIMYMIQLVFPPLVTLAVIFLLAATVHPAALIDPRLAPLSHLLLPFHGAMAAVMLAYVLCPVAVMGLPARYLADLLLVPYYAVWKLAVSAGRAPSTWVRTQRESPSQADQSRESWRIGRGAPVEERVI
jgi:cellulose synthase/poly-beta-1,6-N-acetylglucosamine synthase-like glycosyltransferase